MIKVTKSPCCKDRLRVCLGNTGHCVSRKEAKDMKRGLKKLLKGKG